MSNVTGILAKIEQGDPKAAGQLLPLIYDELRKLAAAKLAQEKPGQTLQATALVHEAYLRLVGPGVGSQESGVGEELSALTRPPAPDSRPPVFDSRGHFFAAAAEAMRRILIEQARRKQAAKRGGGEAQRVNLDLADAIVTETPLDLLALDEALEEFARQQPLKAELVKLRFFAGLTMPEAAGILGISLATAERHWTFARSWLYAVLADSPPGNGPAEKKPNAS